MFRTMTLGVAGLVLGVVAVALTVTLITHPNERAEAHSPHPGLDFSVGADVDGDGVDDCDTSGGPTECESETGSFSLTVSLDDLGDIATYKGVWMVLDLEGVDFVGNPARVWPGCDHAGDGMGIQPFLTFGCRNSSGATSSYLGPIGRVSIHCDDSEGRITLVAEQGTYATTVTDPSDTEHSEQLGNDVLTIDCGATPTPTRTPTSSPVPPTATPCPPEGCPPLNFAIGIDVDGDGTNDCGTGVPLAVGDGAPDPVPREVTNTDCVAEADAKLIVRAYLMDGGGVAAVGSAVQLYYSGLASLAPGDAIWAGCVFEAPATGPNYENVGCAIGLPPYSYPVSNLGALAVFRFSCTQGGDLALGHSVGETALTDESLVEHREAGPDALAVMCGDRTPATGPNPTWTATPTRPRPTATLCGGPCPTPTATYVEPTPTPCPTCPSPQFAIGIDTNGDGTNDCGTGVPRAVGDGAPDAVAAEVMNTTCEAVPEAALFVNVYLTNTDGVLYAGQASHVYYEGVTSTGRGEETWEGCVFSATAYAPYGLNTSHWENVGCAIGLPPALAVGHLGLMSRYTFTCAEYGTVRLGHGVGETSLTDDDLHEFREQGGRDVLEVECGSVPKRETVAGDSDCNWSVSSVDAALILQHAAGLIGRLRCTRSADVDGDGFVTAIDAALVLQNAAGLTEIGP